MGLHRIVLLHAWPSKFSLHTQRLHSRELFGCDKCANLKKTCSLGLVSSTLLCYSKLEGIAVKHQSVSLPRVRANWGRGPEGGGGVALGCVSKAPGWGGEGFGPFSLAQFALFPRPE